MIMLSERAAGRDNNLTLLRIIAASAVLVPHAYPIAYGAGTLAVYTLFTISGFLIVASDMRPATLERFLTIRTLRQLTLPFALGTVVFLWVDRIGLSIFSVIALTTAAWMLKASAFNIPVLGTVLNCVVGRSHGPAGKHAVVFPVNARLCHRVVASGGEPRAWGTQAKTSFQQSIFLME